MTSSQISYLAVLVFSLACTSVSLAQEVRIQDQVAPPPLKVISHQDRMTIDAAKDSKARVRAALDLAELHLTNAETKTSQVNYDEAASEAGQYRAIMEDLFAYLGTLRQDSNKTRDLYKRVELTLRSEGPRLNIIRRTTPAAYAIWIKDIEEYARHGRTEALNSFYGHTVIRDQPVAEKPGAVKLQNNAAPPKKQ